MKILLAPDPAAPNGQDAFCRELGALARARGHQTPARSDAAEESGADIWLINGVQPEIFSAARSGEKKVAFRLLDSCAWEDPKAREATQGMAREADRLLLPSEHLAAVARTWGCNGNIRIVPYAYDRIMAGRVALLTPGALKPSAFPLIACLPLREESKPGLETLFSAISRLRLDCHLSVIGEGPLLTAFQSRARDLLIADRVSFPGALHPARVGDCLRAARAYVDPCGLDGFPNWALQSLAEGCPVISAKAGALPEIIRHGQNGLCFAPGDAAALAEAIVSLYSQRGLSIQLIGEGIKTVEKHNWTATAEAALKALEEIA